tara:strand:- start:241 stop:783 length:543 start_codon:yes stop_codon:yes gene_type:complete
MHINLKQKYYFTNKLDTNIIDRIDNKTSIIYRNYKKKINISKLLKFKNYCKKKRTKFYLSNNFKLALKLNLNGVYIPSFNKSPKHLSFSLKKDFTILGSAHNNKEIKIKEIQKVEYVFLSSIFKKNNNYLGINKFKLTSNLIKKKYVALGGISKKNIQKLNLINCSGFAGISFFEQKKGP